MNNTTPAAFGDRKPGALLHTLISFCHDPQGRITGRLLAPLVRKIVVNRRSMLPVDICVEGINLRCQFTDNYSEKKFVFTPWRYDFKERCMLKDTLAQGGTFIDIGANVGLYTLTAAQAMSGKPGKILAFEPNPVTMARLKFNVDANALDTSDKVVLLNHGIADRETSFTLNIDTRNLGASSIANEQKSPSGPDSQQTIEIPCRPLLETLHEQGITSIDALKIDIEGAEDLALIPFLEAAPDCLLPGLVVIENSEHRWKGDVHGALVKRGYDTAYRGKMNSVFRLGSARSGR